MELKIAFLIVLLSSSSVMANSTYDEIVNESHDLMNSIPGKASDEVGNLSEFYLNTEADLCNRQ